jgi:hypothetical protein
MVLGSSQRLTTSLTNRRKTTMDASLRPDDFACAMQAHWTNPDTLNNVSSPALMSLWTVMADTFNKAIEGNLAANNPFRDNPENGKWMVLSPATGSGKT